LICQKIDDAHWHNCSPASTFLCSPLTPTTI